ncbi:hypothetical protein HK096_001945 [Nowakowskiella sp. JEL0078]|nr:hypothetical protein HK096_001945 [Nowakowskiella sp. JEL0078]
MYRRIGGLWATFPTVSFELMTTEGAAHVVAGRDVVCWRSHTDVWPQPSNSFLQNYNPTGTRKNIQLAELNDPLEFEKFNPKSDMFIQVRMPKPNEETLTLENGDVQRINHDLDCIAHKVNAIGESLGAEYILKKSVLEEVYERVD